MKKILFLDDCEIRHNTFKSKFKIPDTQVEYVYTASKAISALKNKLYNVVFLDHDLGGQSFVKSGKNTGYEVALFIATMPADKRPYQVIIHSHNPVGALNMKRALQNAVKKLQIIPFSELFLGENK